MNEILTCIKKFETNFVGMMSVREGGGLEDSQEKHFLDEISNGNGGTFYGPTIK